MRATRLLVVAAAAVTWSCGDGVGRPIVEGQRTLPQAGAGAGAMEPNEPPQGEPGFGGRGVRDTSGWSGRTSGGEGPRREPIPEVCRSVEEWPEELVYAEVELLNFLNFMRELGVVCAGDTTGVSVQPLAMKPPLRCAARLHSRDMAERNFFDTVNPDGVGPEDRMRETGYTFRFAAESIARDEQSESMAPYHAFERLFSEGGYYCANLVDPAFNSVGIGRFDDLWTVDLAVSEVR